MDIPAKQLTDATAFDDFIFAGHKLLAVRWVRAHRGCSLSDAAEALYARYRELRASQPERFTLDETTYWEGFYS
jgi:hypothetical protein